MSVKELVDILISEKKVEDLGDGIFKKYCSVCGKEEIGKYRKIILGYDKPCIECRKASRPIKNQSILKANELASQNKIRLIDVKYYEKTCELCGCIERKTIAKILRDYSPLCYGCKSTKTNMEKYGFKIGSMSDEVKRKTEQTNLAKYGFKTTSEAPQTKEKMRQTCIDRFGVPSTFESPDIKKKIENTNIDRYGVKSYSQTKEFMQNQSKKWYLMWEPGGIMRDYWENLSPEELKAIRQKMSANIKCSWQNGKLREWYDGLTDNQKLELKKKSSKKYNYGGISFDSSWEIALFIYLIDHNIDFEYQCEPIEYYDTDNTKHLYFPDFRINGQLTEIKGDQFFTESGQFINPYDRSEKTDEHNKRKYECMIENNVNILRSADMKKYVDYIADRYGKDFLKSLRS